MNAAASGAVCPVSRKGTSEGTRANAHPPGPGFPRQAPSVYRVSAACAFIVAPTVTVLRRGDNVLVRQLVMERRYFRKEGE